MSFITHSLYNKCQECGYYDKDTRTDKEIIEDLQKENKRLRKDYNEILEKYNALCKKLANNVEYMKLRLKGKI